MTRFFPVKPKLLESEIQQGLNTVVKDGITSYIMVTLIGGAFLTDYALKLGASNLVIGLITAITVLANLLQVPSVYIVEHFRNRRAVTVASITISRLALLGLVLIPFLYPRTLGIPLLLGSMAIYALIAAISACSWNSWMRDLIPMDCLGVFMARRMGMGTWVSMLFSLAAGFGIDYWKVHYPTHILVGYAAICLMGAAAGLLGIYFVTQIPEPEMEPAAKNPDAFNKILLPFQDRNFSNLIWYLGPWNFALNLAVPFFNLYMLKYLGLPLSAVVMLTLLQQLVYVISLRLWGRLTDRFSCKTVLSLCSPLYLASVLGWIFTALPGKWALTIPLLVLLNILQGMANSGFLLGTYNISLKLAPRGNATTYLAAISIVNSLAAGLAPLISGSLVDWFGAQKLVLNLSGLHAGPAWLIHIRDFQYWDFFFVISFVLGLASLLRLRRVQESGDAGKEELRQEILAEIRQRGNQLFAPLGVLRLVYHWPFAAWNNIIKRRPQDQACAEEPNTDEIRS